MRFKYLTELGDNFLSEEGTAGHRMAALSMLETHLKKAMVDLKTALKASPATAAAPAAGLTGVAALRAKH
ncbi:MAG: hypothetical protein K2W96_06135 [Gemmataceae bacterium]|nr:hypothetical protein [Gemmataceae bacterium]